MLKLSEMALGWPQNGTIVHPDSGNKSIRQTYI
jgi:hypothetical protein